MAFAVVPNCTWPLAFQIGVVGIVLLQAFRLRHRLHCIQQLSQLPGPPTTLTSIVFGQLGGLLGAAAKGTAHLLSKELHEKYGPVFRLMAPIFLPGPPAIVFTDFKHPFVQPDGKRTDRPPFLNHLFPKSLLALPTGHPMWGVHRRAVGNALLSDSQLKIFFPQILQASKAVATRFLEAGTVDVYPILHAWALDLVGRIGYGIDFRAADGLSQGRRNPYAEGAETFLQEIVGLPGLFRYWPPRWRRRRQALGVYKDAVRFALSKGQASPADKSSNALVHTLKSAVDRGAGSSKGSFVDPRIAAVECRSADVPVEPVSQLSASDRKGEAPQPLPEDEIIDELMGLLFAAAESTANTFCWTLWLLAKHPEQQAVVRSSLTAYVNEENEQAKFAALQAVEEPLHTLYEAMRVISTTPLVPRIVLPLEGLELPSTPKGGTTYCIPRGSLLMWNRTVEGPMGQAFDIHRLKGMTDRRQLDEASDIPFLEGKRKCVGYRLAELEMLTLLAELLACSDVRPDPQGRPVEQFSMATNGPKRTGMHLFFRGLRGGADEVRPTFS